MSNTIERLGDGTSSVSRYGDGWWGCGLGNGDGHGDGIGFGYGDENKIITDDRHGLGLGGGGFKLGGVLLVCDDPLWLICIERTTNQKGGLNMPCPRCGGVIPGEAVHHVYPHLLPHCHCAFDIQKKHDEKMRRRIREEEENERSRIAEGKDQP